LLYDAKKIAGDTPCPSSNKRASTSLCGPDKTMSLDTRKNWLLDATQLTFDVFHINLAQLKDRNVLPHVHLILVFIHSLSILQQACNDVRVVLELVPWAALAQFLTELARLDGLDERIQHAGLEGTSLRLEHDDARPLPEDHVLRGLCWTRGFFDADWFDSGADEDATLFEVASTTNDRVRRVLLLGLRLSKVNVRNC